MPAIANITVADGQVTPINHIYEPAGVSSDGTAKWVENVGGSLTGRPQFSINVTSPKGTAATAASKVRLKLTIPRVVSGTDLNGMPYSTILSRPLVDVVFNLTGDMAQAQRDDIHGLLVSFLGNASVKEAIRKVVPFY